MKIKQISVERVSVTSLKSFERVVAGFEAAMGHPDMDGFRKDVAASKTFAEVESVVNNAIGTSGLMEFTRFDVGEILRKEHGEEAPKILRMVIGNPLIMKQMVEHVPDAASYAPVTILIDEQSDGVHLSYDRMTSLLAPYGNVEALKVARELDAKIEALLAETAVGAE